MSVEDLLEGRKEILDAFDGYEEAEDFYEGNVEEIFASPLLRKKLEITGEHFKINLIKTAVDVVSNSLEVASVIVPGDEKLTQVLQQEVWDDNSLDLVAPDIHHNTLEFGDSFVIVWPKFDDDGDVAGVGVNYNSPQVARIIYDEENPDEPKFLVKMWRTVEDRFRLNLYYDNRVERYITKQAKLKGDEASHWEEFREDEDEEWPIPNPYGFPGFHFRTRRPYGKPEHKSGYGSQNAINKIIITHMGTVDYQGFPQRYALIDPQFDEEDDEATEYGTDDSISDNPTPQESTYRAGPGELWIGRGWKDAGQFSAAQPSVFIDPAEFYIRMMAQTTETPLHYFDPSGDKPSGESLKTADAPRKQKVKHRKASFRATWEELLPFAMRILGHEDVSVELQWMPEAIEDTDSWKTNELKLKSGVPVRQVLLEAGYPSEQVDKWLAGFEDQDISRKIEMLEKLARVIKDMALADDLSQSLSLMLDEIINQLRKDMQASE